MKTLIIAEAGVNHNGDIKLALQLIAEAAAAGADLIKFQSFISKNLVSLSAPKADYQKRTTQIDESQYEMIRKLELSRDDHIALIDECQKRGIGFFSTAFDIESIEMLEELDCLEQVKIPSGELTNLPLLRRLSQMKKPIILSTGMATLGEISDAIDAIEIAGGSRELITVLHCTTEYPAPINEVNLSAMLSIRQALGVRVGYSDHTSGIEIPIAAVALGATVIEKHFTLDKSLPGPDHKASLEPNELKSMVLAIRNVEQALGDGIKRPTKSELKNKEVARKSIVARKAIRAGEKFTEDNICTKRPGTGISPMRWDELIGRAASRDFKEDELIQL